MFQPRKKFSIQFAGKKTTKNTTDVNESRYSTEELVDFFLLLNLLRDFCVVALWCFRCFAVSFFLFVLRNVLRLWDDDTGIFSVDLIRISLETPVNVCDFDHSTKVAFRHIIRLKWAQKLHNIFHIKPIDHNNKMFCIISPLNLVFA